MTTTLVSPPPAPKKTSLKPTAKLKAKAYQSVNPFDGKTVKTFEELTDPQLETAIKTAASCFEIWRNKSFAERAMIVTKAASLMRAHAEEFARPVTLEMGKLIADIIDYQMKNADVFSPGKA
jgi:succinate-semialdehyde dehydrogenase/glutarate-semialdehyde dehydrogenase